MKSLTWSKTREYSIRIDKRRSLGDRSAVCSSISASQEPPHSSHPGGDRKVERGTKWAYQEGMPSEQDIPTFDRYLKCEYFKIPRDSGFLGIRVLSPEKYKVGNPLCVFFPGRWQNSLFWAHQEPSRDFRIKLALAGYTVATLDYRTHFLSARSKPKMELIGHGLETIIEDAISGLRTIQEHYAAKSTFLLGFSFGAALACLVQSDSRVLQKTSGIVLLDGGIKSSLMKHSIDLEDNLVNMPSLEVENTAWDSEFRRLVKESLYSLERMKGQVSSHRQFRLLGIPMNGDYLRLLLIGDRWWPRRMIVETQAIADYKEHPSLKWDKFLNRIQVPMLGFAAGPSSLLNKHPTIVTMNACSSTDKTIVRLPEWNHLEVLFGKKRDLDIGNRMLTWLKNYSKEGT